MKLNVLKKKWVWVIIILIVLGIGFALHGKNKQVVQVTQDIKNVKVQKILRASISTNVEYPGKLQAVHEVVVTPKMAGKVAAVNINVGDSVKPGQVLFTLDSTGLAAQLQQQQAALDSANVNLVRTKDSGLEQQIIASQQALERAQIAYNDAKTNYDKTKQLYDEGVESKQSLDNAKTRLDGASIDLKTAQDNLDLLKQKSGPQSIQVAQSQVQQAQAGVNYVRSQLEDLTITSPISGVVASKNVEVGEIASAPASSVTIIDTTSLVIEINVSDTIVQKIKVGQQVSLNVSTLEDKSITGVIDNISPDADPKTNLYTIKVKVDNSKGELRSGMFARVSLPAEKKDNILTVPNEAIVIENGVKYIYIVENNIVRKIAVETGVSNDTITEISGNVKEGAELITEGQNLLNEGEKVNIVK